MRDRIVRATRAAAKAGVVIVSLTAAGFLVVGSHQKFRSPTGGDGTPGILGERDAAKEPGLPNPGESSHRSRGEPKPFLPTSKSLVLSPELPLLRGRPDPTPADDPFAPGVRNTGEVAQTTSTGLPQGAAPPPAGPGKN